MNTNIHEHDLPEQIEINKFDIELGYSWPSSFFLNDKRFLLSLVYFVIKNVLDVLPHEPIQTQWSERPFGQ